MLQDSIWVTKHISDLLSPEEPGYFPAWMQQLDLLFFNKAVFFWRPRYGHSLHCAKVSSGLLSSHVTKFKATPYSIGSKTQQNSPCPGKQVKERMWSTLPFDMVSLELFSGFRDGGSSCAHTPCLYLLIAIYPENNACCLHLSPWSHKLIRASYGQ